MYLGIVLCVKNYKYLNKITKVQNYGDASNEISMCI